MGQTAAEARRRIPKKPGHDPGFLVAVFRARGTFIGEMMTIPFERPHNRVQTMADRDYYKLHNYTLDFSYNRFAHDDVG